MVISKKRQSIPASPQDRKNSLQRYVLKKLAPSHKLRVEDVATIEIDQYIHSQSIDTYPLEWWKTYYVDYSHLVKSIYVFPLQWNLCIVDTLGPTKGVQIIKVS